MYGATCAMSLPSDINRTGRIVVGNSWFGSVKTVNALKESDLYFVKLKRKAHKQFPQESRNLHMISL